MLFEFQKTSELDARRRKGLALSLGLHGFLLLLLLFNPELLSTTPRRVVRVEGEDYDRDRFEAVELYIPPEVVVPPPEVAEPPPPELVPPEPEIAASPPPPAPAPPAVPPPVIGPEDVIAEGARPDASGGSSEGQEEAALQPPPAPPPGAAGEGGDGDGEDDAQARSEDEPASSGREDRPDPVAETAENTNPNGLLLPNLRRLAESLIDETARNSRSAAGSGEGRDTLPNLTTDRPEILSDTRGYDFGPYMNQVINRVRTNWYALIPEAARIGTLRGRVVIIFTITGPGRIEDLRAVAPSGSNPLDRAAVAAIQASNPFPELPADFEGDRLVLQFTFLYNMTPE